MELNGGACRSEPAARPARSVQRRAAGGCHFVCRNARVRIRPLRDGPLNPCLQIGDASALTVPHPQNNTGAASTDAALLDPPSRCTPDFHLLCAHSLPASLEAASRRWHLGLCRNRLCVRAVNRLCVGTERTETPTNKLATEIL